MNEEVIKQRSSEFNWTENQRNIALAVLTENLMDDNAIKAAVHTYHPRFSEFIDHWSKSGIDHFELTSVGIAITHSYIGSSYAMNDLSIWL